MLRLFANPVYQFFVTLSPWIAIWLLATFWEPLFNATPEKASLIPLTGTVQRIGKSNGVVNTNNGRVAVEYDCLCNYGWGEKQFEQGMTFTALGQHSDDGYHLWELSVDGRTLINYEDTAPRLLERRETAMRYALPAIILFALMSLQLAARSLRSRREEKCKKPLYPLLDQLHDQDKSDKKRLAVLPEILKFDPDDTLGPLEFMATQNTNSEAFLTHIGTALGEIWATLDIEELESITLVQPAAKRAAMAMLKKKAPKLTSELDALGALKLGH